MPHDHLLSVVGDLFLLVHPHHKPIGDRPDHVERLALRVPPEGLDVDALVETLEDPRRLGVGSPHETKHARLQPPADGGLKEFFRFFLRQVPVFRRELPRDAFRGWFLLGENRRSQKRK